MSEFGVFPWTSWTSQDFSTFGSLNCCNLYVWSHWSEMVLHMKCPSCEISSSTVWVGGQWRKGVFFKMFVMFYSRTEARLQYGNNNDPLKNIGGNGTTLKHPHQYGSLGYFPFANGNSEWFRVSSKFTISVSQSLSSLYQASTITTTWGF